MEELEKMREQLDAMKSLLNTQQIVTDKLMRRVMQSRWSWVNNLVAGEIVALPFIYLALAAICSFTGISQWYALSFLIIAAIDTAIDWRTVRIPKRMFSEASIVQLKKFLLRQKKERFIQYCVSIPAVIIWCFYFLFAMYARTNTGAEGDFIGFLYASICGGAIGAVIGIIIVIVLIRKVERAGNTILQDIDELEKGE